MSSVKKISLDLIDAEATIALGRSLGRVVKPGTVLLLEGDLGAGKTTLVQGIGQGLDIDDLIVSPTFTLICEYLEGRIPLYHLDLYRLEPDQVESLHLESYWSGLEVTPGLMVIEWSDRLPYQPPQSIHLQLLYTPDFSRKAVITLDVTSPLLETLELFFN